MMTVSVVQLFCMAHLLLLSTLISPIRCQTIVKSATLSAAHTHLNTAVDGVTLMANIAEVNKFNDAWSVLVLSQSSWQFIISLDDSFGFDEHVPSAIRITMNASSITTDEFLFGFTTDNQQYVSVSLPMDNIGRSNRIYPRCNPSVVSSTSFADGDIASVPNFDRNCDVAGGSCLYWQNMIPPNHETQTTMPITFILEHDPTTHTLTMDLDKQRCVFGAGYQAANGLKLYVAGNNPGESFMVSSFDIAATVRDPTTSPTTDPTVYPTTDPTHSPTINPTIATANPSKTPTTTPTANPSMATANPSTVPTLSPTLRPTGPPTDLPTRSPTTVPTTSPTSRPTTPTLAPVTLQPSANPTKRPTTLTPTRDPTTLQPTNVPTTAAPTRKPLPPGFVWGAFDQMCPESVTHTGLCRTPMDIISASNVLCLQPYDCCMCEAIECGYDGIPCRELRVGPFGAYGVKDIRVSGSVNAGAGVDCQGRQSCSEAAISADHVSFIDCDGKEACQNSTIRITEPKQEFALECAGVRSCSALDVEINLNAPAGELCSEPKEVFTIQKISCNDKFACEGLDITINNRGCQKVVIENLECLQPDACNDASFNLIGDVEIQNCFCGPSCSNTIGLSQCFENLERVLCPDPLSCALQSKTITNPRNNFEFICSDVQSCEGADFVIELNKGIANPVHSLSKVLFGGLHSGREATFTIQNEQAFTMSIELIECGGSGSCVDTTFVIGTNVFIENIICASDACFGCVIKQTPTGPGIPCDSSDVRPLTMSGNFA